jgi:adenosylmethionine-8-amino-7-oxononanoate aminotransferase
MSNNPNSTPSAVFHREVAATPPMILRGSGVYLEDDRGRRYLDGNASAGVVGVGHGRTEIAKSLAAAGETVPFVYGGSGFSHPWQEKLAEALLSIAPDNISKVYFVSGGSEATESALKLARQYFVETGKPQKYKLVSRWQSYHGVTIAALSLSGRTSWRKIYAPYLLPVTHIAPPYAYRCPYCAASTVCSLSCADELERAILLEGPETVAAFFAEPIVGTSATGLVPAAGYYERIRSICNKYDVLFVADEVLCGYGRTGRAFAIQHWDAQPDIITMGKALGSGYAPIGAMLVSQRIERALRQGSGRFVHGFTYSGMPSACFVALKVFEIMTREGLFERPGRLGLLLQDKLLSLANKHEVIGEIRGRGLLVGVEFVANRKTRRPFPKEVNFTTRVVAAMRERGVLVSPGVPLVNLGRDGDHIQISPPFIIDETGLEEIVAALDEAIDVATEAIVEGAETP